MARDRIGDDGEEPRRDSSDGNLVFLVVLAVAAALLLLCGGGGVGLVWMTRRAVVVERDRVEAIAQVEAAADARRAVEVEAQMNEGRPPPLGREEWRKRLVGKMEDEVLKELGKPVRTNGKSG
jgi:hypothetical protein